MNAQQMASTARELVAVGKGILAADESSPTIKKRFDSINVESSESNRRDYRELLFRTVGVSEYISGVILYDETIRQSGADGTPLVDVLRGENIIPGIKVDKGGKYLVGSLDEKITEGLDGLGDRLSEYRDFGARFTKWRALIIIGPRTPSQYCMDANAHALARYAVLSQEAGLVPIIEPEVLMDGEHDIDSCYEATEATLREVFYQLGRQGVNLECTLLKPNMVLSGKSAANRASPDKVADKTIACFKRVVPAAIPGVVFLSGGQSDREAIVNLDAINRRAAEVGAPWELSFSYGRALQEPVLKVWGGSSENAVAAQHALTVRARYNGAARDGKYSAEMEPAA